MEAQIKTCTGIISFGVALIAPTQTLIICAIVFVFADLVTGLMAYHARNRRSGTRGCFRIERAWNTVTKLVFMMLGIVLAWVVDNYILADLVTLHLARIFTAMACGFEFLSILRNMGYVSNHPLFKFFSKYVSHKFSEAGIPIEEINCAKEEKEAK